MKQITTHLLLYLLTLTSIAFSQTVRISFTGKDAQSGGVVTMDSIRITNMTLGRDTVLRNSFIIDLSIATGIGDPVVGLPGTMELTGNFANPFQDETSFRVSTIHGGTLDIGVFTLTGKRQASFRTTVAPGENSFSLKSGSLAPGVYVITAQMKDGIRSVRVVKTGSTGFGEPVIMHTGTRSNTARMKKSTAVTFRFIGFAKTFIPDSIFAAPLSDTTIQFSFRKSSTAPVIDQFVARSYSVGAGNPVTYDVQVRDSDGDLKSVSIDYEGDGTFDDSSAVVGSTATKTFTKSFQQAGSYRAEIRALDEKGNSTKGTLPQAVIVQGSAPALTTTSVSNITTTTATSGGMISSDGGSPITARGVCWSTANNPTINDAKTSDGTGTGSFSSSLTGLSPNTKYYVRAYATNSAGTNYGNEVSFTTQGQMPQLSTSSVTNISTTTATSGGTITSDGGSAITARGVCWSHTPSPTTLGNKTTDGSGIGTFVSTITGLTAGTTYYVRAYATNSTGTGYGNEITFLTQPENLADTAAIGTQVWMTKNLDVSTYRNGDPIPEVTDSSQWANLTTGAWCYYNNDPANGAVYGKLYNGYAVNDPRGLAPTGWHVASDSEWTILSTFLGGESVAGGKMKETGTTHWHAPNTGADNSSGFTALPGGYRNPNQTFLFLGYYGYWWASARSREIDYDRVEIFRSGGAKTGGFSVRCVKGDIPSLTTAAISNIRNKTATSGGTITSDGGSAITARGVCWSTSPSPTILNSKTTDSSGTGSFVSNITGILPDSLYYIRAYATNGVGTAYGNELSFNTLPSASYDTVKIGNQVWMLKNLNVSTYRNGDTIPEVTDPTEWKQLKNTGTGARCYYFNDPSVDTAYGKLYNWFAVNDPRGLAPAGWHIPTEAEWATLITFLGGEAVAGGNMKETGTVHWKPGNLGATNSSGFTALPGGSRNGNGSYHNLNKEGYWWSSSMSDSFFVWSRVMVNYDASALRYDESDISGISVRCIRGDKPSLTTDSVTSITQTTATSGGTITSDGGLPVTERGVCWSTNPAPTISANKTSSGSGTGSFMSNITGLSANTKYYVRAYATNSAGTSYGNERTFTTQQAVFYDTVLIGSQVWMRSNLNVSTYRNGDPITHVPDTSQWENLTTGAWCYYRNNATTGAVYGKLYNWYAVNDPRGLAPEGWHVATDAEWTTLTTYLGGENDAGGKLKEAGGSHWDPPNTAATNSSGFTALPGGYLNADMNFYDLRRQGVWWTATEDDASRAWSREIRYNQSEIRREWATKSAGLSVRCVKD